MEKGERARLRVGGSHTSLNFKDGVPRTVGIRTHHQNGSKKLNGMCKNLSTIALTRNGPPSLSGKDNYLVSLPSSLFPEAGLFLFVTTVVERTKEYYPQPPLMVSMV